MLAAVLLAAVALIIAAVSIGNARWMRETRAAETLLGSVDGRVGTNVANYSPDMLDGLPAPVVRYFHFALTPGQGLISDARIRHKGTFAIQPDKWQPFTSEQHFRVQPPGFVWDAAVRIGALPSSMAVRVRDSYIDGEGAMHAAVAAALPVVNQRGTPELAAGSLARYLGEAVWFPTALLPGRAGAGVTWKSVDDSTAVATLTDGEVSVAATFHFGASGEVMRVSGERFREVNGVGHMTPWEGHLEAYTRRHGMMVPSRGEVAWLPPEGRRAYWRADIVDISYTWREDAAR